MPVFALVLAIAIGLSLGLLGGGGSILTVPFFVYVLGLEDKPAVGASLLVVAVASFVAAIPYATAGHVRWRAALLFGVASMVTAALGGAAARFVPGRALLVAFAALMLVTGAAMWRGRRERSEPAGGARAAPLAAVGALVGFVTGLLGAGGGFLIVPALILLAGLPMRAAVGTSLAVIAANSLAGWAGYASHAQLPYLLVGVVAAIAALGSVVGSRLARRIAADRLRRGFAVFVVFMGGLVLWRELGRASTLSLEAPHAHGAATSLNERK